MKTKLNSEDYFIDLKSGTFTDILEISRLLDRSDDIHYNSELSERTVLRLLLSLSSESEDTSLEETISLFNQKVIRVFLTDISSEQQEKILNG